MKPATKKTLIIISAIIAILIVIAGCVAYHFYCEFTKRFDGQSVRLYVRAENGQDALRDSLTATLGEKYGNDVFNVWKHISDKGTFKSGSYIINPDDKAINIARRIMLGMQDPVKVTFNNVRTLNQLYSRVADQLALSEDQFAAAVDSVFTAKGVKPECFVARMLPDTYEFYWTASGQQVVDRLSFYYDQFWNEDRIAKANKLNLTPDQVATVASIVEEESAKADEHGKIAGLYLNRLRKGMKLQADPTVKFALGDFAVRRITREMLNIDSPYNTYLHVGLPPGPIRMPAKRTIDTVLNSGPNNYIYMCAKEDFSGYHNFTSDYNTHLANGQRYRAALDARGIK